MKDVFKIAETIVEQIKSKYADDIAIVAYYGSYAQGRANKKSDLDFFFIPANKRGFELSLQFVVEGIGFDFFPISWERAEEIASFKQPIVAVIAESKILYARSEKDLNRFNKLRDKISDFCKTENKQEMTDKAYSCLEKCFIYLYNMQKTKSSLTNMRIEAYRLLTSVLQSLAYLNQTYYKRGWGQNMEQVFSLKIKPENLKSLIHTITTEQNVEEIKSSCEDLVSITRELILSEQKTLNKSQMYSELFNGFYEEIKSSFNKIITACDRNDYYTAYFTSLNVQIEISEILAKTEESIRYTDLNTYDEYNRVYFTLDLPDLTGIIDENNLESLKTKVLELDEKLKQILINEKVSLKLFSTLDEFKLYINNNL